MGECLRRGAINQLRRLSSELVIITFPSLIYLKCFPTLWHNLVTTGKLPVSVRVRRVFGPVSTAEPAVPVGRTSHGKISSSNLREVGPLR